METEGAAIEPMLSAALPIGIVHFYDKNYRLLITMFTPNGWSGAKRSSPGTVCQIKSYFIFAILNAVVIQINAFELTETD